MKRSSLKRKIPLGRSKFGNIETEYKGVLYRSKAEAHYAMYLASEKKKGVIRDWHYETRIKLEINGKWVCDVLWDFWVLFKDGHEEYHEIKGRRTDVFILKEKIFRALFPNRYLKIINAKLWSNL